jgi:two-component system phosphate regulon response regulator PhoB
VVKEKIIVVDDEKDILELVRYNLDKEGYKIVCVDTGEKAIAEAKKKNADLMILDLMLPGIDGFELCKILKNDPATRDILIIMLTAKGEEADIVTGLELGADDYITKPFSPRVLLARIKAVLRRRIKSDFDEQSLVKIKDIIINPGRHEVTIGGKPVELTYTEFRILQFLASRPGWVFTRYQIIDGIRGSEYAVTDRSVDVQIAGLRKKLGKHGKYIETIRGVGYRFKE